MKCDTPQTQKPQPSRGSALLFLDHSSLTNAKSTWRLSKRAPYLWRECVCGVSVAVYMCVVMCWVCVDSLSQSQGPGCVWALSVCGYVCLFPPWNDVMCTHNQSHHLVVCGSCWFAKTLRIYISLETNDLVMFFFFPSFLFKDQTSSAPQHLCHKNKKKVLMLYI